MPKKEKNYISVSGYEYNNLTDKWDLVVTKYFLRPVDAMRFAAQFAMCQINTVSHKDYVYATMCSGCEHEKRCHEQCVTCEDYDDAIAKGEL